MFKLISFILFCALLFGCKALENKTELQRSRQQSQKDNNATIDTTGSRSSKYDAGETQNSLKVSSQVSSNIPTKTETTEDQIRFYLNKLKDRTFTSTYGDGYTWYTAAEELGNIGKPAIPHLIGKLDTEDQYELKLVLYSLLLASQDPEVKKLTGGEYIKLGLVLSESSNEENKKIAIEWWLKNNHLWE